MTQEKPTPLLDSPISTVAARQQRLLLRLGLWELPAHDSQVIPVATILVPGEASIQPSRRLMKSIESVGMLQAPIVESLSPDAQAEAHAYQVIIGRRRILAARQLGWEHVTCEVYASVPPHLAALLALTENMQRSSAWIKEAQDLSLLISERVGLTEDELVEAGFDRGSLGFSLKIAQLPPPLVREIFAGAVSQATARRITRLTMRQQEQLADDLRAGAALTAETITARLRGHIDAGLHPLQAAFIALDSTIEPASAGTSSEGNVTEVLAQAIATLTTLLASSFAHHDTALAALARALLQRVQSIHHEHALPPIIIPQEVSHV